MSVTAVTDALDQYANQITKMVEELGTPPLADLGLNETQQAGYESRLQGVETDLTHFEFQARYVDGVTRQRLLQGVESIKKSIAQARFLIGKDVADVTRLLNEVTGLFYTIRDGVIKHPDEIAEVEEGDYLVSCQNRYALLQGRTEMTSRPAVQKMLAQTRGHLERVQKWRNDPSVSIGPSPLEKLNVEVGEKRRADTMEEEPSSKKQKQAHLRFLPRVLHLLQLQHKDT